MQNSRISKSGKVFSDINWIGFVLLEFYPFSFFWQSNEFAHKVLKSACYPSINSCFACCQSRLHIIQRLISISK